ncbi:MAG: T9SS type A sorting domain-containing protein [Bacteroidales bacterium]|nr:T9SS type A sorting domain-containing protein [Bacteroidales bacterium]
MIKRVAYILLLTFISISAFSQKKVRIDLNPSKQTLKNIEVVQNISNGILISESISFIELIEKETKEGTFIELSSDRMYKSYDKGNPNLPLICRLIEIPQNTKPVVKILSYDEEIVKLKDYNLLKEIIPAQPSLSKSDDPEKVLFYKNKDIYSRNEFFKNEIVKYEDRGFLRSKHLGYIEISPFEYNPIENTLKILNNIQVEVSFVDDVSTKSINTKTLASPYFENLSLNTLNTSSDPKALISNPVKYVIVSDRMFEETLQPFIEWKIMKGFTVIEAYTDDENVGNTTINIKAYLTDLYDNPVDGVSPTFVLFVGDVAQIPTFYTQLIGFSHYTDLYYCEYTGDKLPEVFYGRFSAESIDELQPQIDKTLEIEKYEMPDPTYLDNVVLVAGVDGSYAPTHGNGAINYANDNYTNLDNSINSYFYLYEDASGVMSSSNADASASIRSYISSGVSFTNYTAHCGSSGWSDPSFNINHIDGLTNDHMYPLIIGNCCQSNTFYNDDCFGEEILMAANKGAVGYIGGSNLTYWDEDYYWGVGLTETVTPNPTYENSDLGVYDRFFHLNGEDKQDWYITQGQINVAGNLAVEAFGSSLKDYYWEIYHLMGDPSLTPFVTVPSALISSYNSEIVIGTSDFQVITEEDAYVAISFEGVLLDAQLADATGIVELSFISLSDVGVLDIVITKQNRQPKIDEIIIVPATTPYIILDHYLIDDALENNNSEVDYGESIKLHIQLKNLSGNLDAYNVMANISTVDTNIIISDDTQEFGTILKSDSAFIEASFTIEFKNKFIDQQKVSFDLEIVGEDVSSYEYAWDSKISITVNAPEIEIGNLLIDDSSGNNDGVFDPDETGDIKLIVTNTGNAAIDNLNGILAIIGGGETYLTVNNSETGSFSLNAQESDTLKFNATADSGTPSGKNIYFTLEVKDVSYNFYSASESKELVIGEVPEILISDENAIITTSAYFYDAGGKTGDYTDNENDTITFEPDDINKFISVNFLSFDVESHSFCDYDKLQIYNGLTTEDELIGEYCGTSSPGNITANNSDGALTFVFISDISDIRSGWKADIRSIVGIDYQITVQGSAGVIQDAIVEFNDKTETTDASGIVNFNNVPEGINYLLKASAIGYNNFEKFVNIFENTAEEIQLDVSKYNVSYNLFGEDEQYIDGEVSFDGKTLSTTKGVATFTNVEYGLNREYTIQTYGHNDSIANLDVTSDLSENIILNAIKYNVEFAITDGTNPIQNVLVEFDDKNEFSNSSGIAFFDQVNMDTMLIYTVRKSGYNNIIDTMNVLKDSTVNLIMETGFATYKVSYLITGESRPIYNAQVILDEDTLYTDAQGIAVFDSVLEANDIPYKISKTHFNDEVGSANVLGNNLIIEKELSYKSYEITFEINDGTDPVEGAIISFNGKSGASNSMGEYVFNVTYSLNQEYNISKGGFAEVADMINIDENKTIEESLSRLFFNVTFEALDAELHIIENVAVEFNGLTQYTDSIGKTIFTEVETGDNLSFTLSKEGFWDYDSTLNLVNADVMCSASLSSTTGITTVNERDFKVYPNPSSGIFNLEILNSKNSTYIVKIYDIIGSVVYIKNIESNHNILEQIDITNKSKGIYLLSIESNKGSVLCKRIITK